MAAMPALPVPVTLTCGATELELGTVDVPMRLTTGTTTSHLGGGLVLPVTVEADTAAFQADLAALLRHAADRIEAGEDRVAQTVAGQEFG